MKLHHITSIMKNDLRVLKKVKLRMLEITYFPLTTLVMWGLFALQSKQYAFQAGLIVLVVNLFWSFTQLAQQEANMFMMEDLWTLNIRHYFIAGITEFEYIIAKLTMSTLVATMVAVVLVTVAQWFGAPLFQNLPHVIGLAGIALLGSLALALFIAGSVLMLGREYAFLCWSSLSLFIFLSAPFYSPSILPAAVRWITEIMPFTYVFEGARAIATSTAIPQGMLLHAALIAGAYFVLAWPYYWWAFNRARKSGMLARIAS